MTDETTETSAFGLPAIETTSERASIETAATELRERRANEGIPNIPEPGDPSDEEAKTPPAVREYQTYKDQHGRIIDPPAAVSARQAATDLEDYREKIRLLAGLEQQHAAEAAQQQQPAQPEPRPAHTTPEAYAQAVETIKSETATPQQRAAAADAIAQHAEATDWQRAQQWSEVARQTIDQNGNAIAGMILSEFGTVDPTELAALAQRDPSAAQRLHRYGASINEIARQHAVQQQVAQQLAAHQQQQWVAEQNKLASARIPDIAALSEHVPAALRDYGFSEHEQRLIYQNGVDARQQAILADAIRYRQAHAARRTIVAKNLPPVQRPGVRQAGASPAQQDVAALSRRLSQTGSAKDAAKLVQAMRRTGR
jgi:hypothetical protein